MMANRTNKRKQAVPGGKFNTAAAILCAVVLVLLIIYLIGAIYFRNHYYPRTTIGSLDAGGQTAEYVARKLDSSIQDYSLTIQDINKDKYTVGGSDIGYTFDTSKEASSVQAIMQSQSAWGWPVSLFRDSSYKLTCTWDESALEKRLSDLLDASAEPVDASISFKEGSYKETKAVYGIKRDDMLSAITDALEAQKTSLTFGKKYYTAPAVLDDDPEIKEMKDQIKQYQQAVITYKIDGLDEKLDADQILALLSVNDSDHKVVVNDEAVKKYVQDLAKKVNTYADVRTFHTQLGDDIQLGGGTYGWVINRAKEVEEIKKDLEAGKPVEREPIWEQTAAGPVGDDIGNSYIEVDYTNQHLYVILNGQRTYESDIVSGNVTKGNGSPDGFYKINYKESPATLVGEDYSSPVTYFNVFAYNVGFHDASWRSTFGGNIYLSSGSHGCINLPLEAAKYIYDNVPVDTPVVCYYRTPVQLTSHNCQVSNAYSYVKTDTTATKTAQ